MYWVVSGGNSNPLVGSILLKQDMSFWDQAQPYLPILTAIVSFVGICITYSIALKARKIADEQKIIAQEKLDTDIFDKRFNVFQNLIDAYNTLNHAYSSELTSELDKNTRDCFKEILPASFLFSNEDVEILSEVGAHLRYAHALIFSTKNFKKSASVSDPNQAGSTAFFSPERAESCFKDLMSKAKDLQALHFKWITQKYTPASLSLPPYKPLATTSPASHPEPQPTVPEQAQ
ncbi:MAG: hypothetical protein ABF430_05690 [Acetobacter persici]|uniref:hypothetical protein n=1 Tax=Acetobacter persici TaxID=1076596 RepID=UPI0039E9413D